MGILWSNDFKQIPWISMILWSYQIDLMNILWILEITWQVKLIMKNIQGAVSIRKTVLPGVAIPMLKIRRPNGRLIFNMEIAIRR